MSVPRPGDCLRVLRSVALLAAVGAVTHACADEPTAVDGGDEPTETRPLDERVRAELMQHGFTGRVEATLEERLGRPVDPRLAEVGRLLFFDPVLSLTRDNSCSGCHGPNASFNDSQSITIGVDNNGVVGPGRRGPHNQRRAPTLINAVFYPRLMWDSRFVARSMNPFDNSQGFVFPPPDETALSFMDHLVGAQAFTPVISRVEMAGSDFPGGYEAIRAEVARRVDEIGEYRARLAEVFPEIEAGDAVGFQHIAAALAEFQFTLVRADAPLDRFARGDADAMSAEEKRGALLFFGRAQCAECHNTQGFSNEMFSDFEDHVIGVPQVTPSVGNVPFDGPGANEDYGLEQQTGDPDDRYKFRTQPLRNVALQPTFMHNGAYRCLEDAIRQHLEPFRMARDYTVGHLDPTMKGALGPSEPVLDRLHDFIPLAAQLSDEDFAKLVEFVRVSLTDSDARPEKLRSLVPASVPSGLPVHNFQFGHPRSEGCLS